MNGPRIGGIEPAEPTEVTPTPRTENPAQDTPVPPREARNAKQGPNWLLMPLAGVALAVATGAGAYAQRLDRRVTIIQIQSKETRAAVQATLDRLNSLKIPKDLSAEVASLEVTANKLRAADEALRRSFDEQAQKLPGLEKRLADAQSVLDARLTDAERGSKAFQEKQETRLTNIIAVLKNQDKVLRRLAETHPAPQTEE